MRPGIALASIAPLAGYCSLVYAVSALTAPPAPDLPFVWGDKVVHATVYAAMLPLAVRAAGIAGGRPPLARRWIPALLFCIVYGASDELHQYFVPGRTCDVFDWLADGVGATVAALALPWLSRWRPVAALIDATRR